MIPPLVVAAFIFAAGIAAGIEWPVPDGGGPLLLLAGAATLLWPIRRRGARLPPGSRSGRWPLVLIAAAGLGAGAHARLSAERSCAVALEGGRRLAVEGLLLSRHEDRGELQLERVDALPGAACGVAVRVSLPAASEWVPVAGDRLGGRGEWWTPPDVGSGLVPIGVLTLDTIWTPADGAGPGAARTRLAVARSRAGRTADRVFGEHAPLARSLLLAQRDGLEREVRDRYARAGLSHLLAISGLHVGLVAGILLLLAGAARLRRGRAAAAGAAGTIGYVLFLGAPHSAVRAATQIVLVLFARSVQRPARPSALMAAAALGLLAVEPAALRSPGFQLSFAGVAGLLVLRWPILVRLDFLARRRIGNVAAGRWLADGLATSIAATLATAPIVAWHFGRIAPIGIVANLAAIPLLAVTVPSLGLAMALAPISMSAASFVGDGAGALLTALDRVARSASTVPWGSVALPGPVALMATTAVAAGLLGVRRIGRARPWVRVAGAVGIAVAVAIGAGAGAGVAGERLEIHVIDVGQGDAIAIRTPADRWILVDAGGVGRGWDAGSATVVPYLSRRGVLKLEGLVLSHPDADHIGGADAVLRSLRPRWVADPAAVVGKDRYGSLLRMAADRDVHWIAPRAGAMVEMDGVAMTFLYPDGPAGAVEDANDVSVVMRVTLGEFDVLMTGDAPASVEVLLAERHGARLAVEVLKVGHHGSITSTHTALLDAAAPVVALVSAGAGNRYGHPHPDVVARLERAGVRIYRTDNQGSIVVRGRPDGSFDVTTER